MLTHLHIRHFAIIDTSEIELDLGMTALTGETGAGKSILLGALGLVLGARASSDSIQQGQKRADITATFTLENMPTLVQWLADNELDAEDDCILRRTLHINGKSRATINDIPVSLQTLGDLGKQLVSIHGQHAHQTLGKSGEQRSLLDAVAGTGQLGKVNLAYQAWKRASEALASYESDAIVREQRTDLLNFQLQEFDELDIGNLAVKDIESEHQWLANADRIMALGTEVLSNLDDQAYPALHQSTKPLAELANMDERLRESLDLVESASIQVAESAQAVRACLGSLEHDDSRLQWLDQKLGVLHRLAKKHQCQMSELPEVEDTLRGEYQQLLDPANSAEELNRECNALRTVYDTEANKLSRHRKKQAKSLAKTITVTMQGLSMTGGLFNIDVQTDATEPRAYGNDTVSFLVSPNLGIKPAPLAKVASGGELSRISLCIQLATLDTRPVPTLVFDEVDTGVGGAVAETVGQLLRQVGSRAQVLCVTHLPQVAAQAHNHLKVSKEVVDGKTHTAVTSLNHTSTRDEIARMLGGAKITKKSRQHAQEMLDSATSAS
ncbi:MAG: DNA repair protein RecN [Granulosicoccus sp.]